MKLRRITSAVTTLALAGAAVAAAAPAQARGDDDALGTVNLAAVLAADGSGFDKNARDFDIVDNAVTAVLTAKPKSPVAVLAQGRTPVTAFVPTDAAFRRLVEDLTGNHYQRERRVFNVLARTVGVDTVEAVLMYHVVPGATITYRQAKAARGATLETALDGATLKVRVRDGKRVFLADADPNDANARVMPMFRNLNVGNRQIAHGISQVLRPADL